MRFSGFRFEPFLGLSCVLGCLYWLERWLWAVRYCVGGGYFYKDAAGWVVLCSPAVVQRRVLTKGRRGLSAGPV